MLDQMEILFDITTYVMLGLLPSNKFTSTLAKELSVSEKQAGLITSQISSEVFVNIRESMRGYEEKLQSTYHTSLGNSQMNANTYPQSFKPITINEAPVVQKPLEPAPVSPHADLEKAGGFTIEVAGNPLSNNETPKVRPVELPNMQESLPEKMSTELKTEPISESFKAHDYYNFRNNSEKEEVVNDIEEEKEESGEEKEVVNDNKEEGGVEEKEIKDVEQTIKKEVSKPIIPETDDSSIQNIVPGRIVFKHLPDMEPQKTQVVEPETIVTVENLATEPMSTIENVTGTNETVKPTLSVEIEKPPIEPTSIVTINNLPTEKITEIEKTTEPTPPTPIISTENPLIEPIVVINNPPIEKAKEKIVPTKTELPEITKQPETKEIVTEIKPEEPTETIEPVEPKKPLADYLISEMSNKSIIPNNLPTEETSIPVETKKEGIPPQKIAVEAENTPPQTATPVQNIPKPVTETKPRAFDPYREILG